MKIKVEMIVDLPIYGGWERGYQSYGEIRDLVKWALDSDVHTEAMRVERVTVEPRGEEAHVRRQR
jgi:hypothetical protein